MTDTKMLARESRIQNLIASAKYALQLAGQIPTTAIPNGTAAVELALIAHALITHDLGVFEGSIPADKTQDITPLLQAACARLGYAISPHPYPTLKHYEVEIRGQRETFRRTFSCPENIDLDEYLAMRLRSRDGYQSHEIIGEAKERLNERDGGNNLQLGENSSFDASTEELVFLGLAKKNGLLQAYEETVRRYHGEKGQAPPRNIDHHFLSFLRTAQQMKLAPPNLQIFVRAFGGQIAVYQAQGIAMVASNGEVRMFFPKNSLNLKLRGLKQPLQLGGVTISRDHRNPTALDSLIRHRYGYVPAGAHIFLEALLHCAGDRGRTMRPVPLNPKKPNK